MSPPAPHDAPLPNWPGLMGRRLACAYLQLSPRSFTLLTRLHGVGPVDCAGLAVRLVPFSLAMGKEGRDPGKLSVAAADRIRSPARPPAP